MAAFRNLASRLNPGSAEGGLEVPGAGRRHVKSQSNFVGASAL